MIFRDLRVNSTVHFLDKGTLHYEEVKVEAVGIPRYDTPKIGQTVPTGQVVDMTIKGTPYVVSCDGSVAYCDKAVFATEKALLLPEVKRLQTEAEGVLENVDKARETVEKCKSLLCELDTAFKEKRETEKRMGAMEEKINSLSDMLKEFIGELKK